MTMCGGPHRRGWYPIGKLPAQRGLKKHQFFWNPGTQKTEVYPRGGPPVSVGGVPPSGGGGPPGRSGGWPPGGGGGPRRGRGGVPRGGGGPPGSVGGGGPPGRSG